MGHFVNFVVFFNIVSQINIQSPKVIIIQVFCSEMPTSHFDYDCLFFQTLHGLSEESSTEHLKFPLLTQRSLYSITELLPFLRTLCCSFQGPPPNSHHMPHFTIADHPAANSDTVLKKLEHITEEEFLDCMES